VWALPQPWAAVLPPPVVLVYSVMSTPVVSVSRELPPEQRSWAGAEVPEKPVELARAIGVAALALPPAPRRVTRWVAADPASRTQTVASPSHTPQPRKQQQAR